MAITKLIMLVGLPGSGKSTHAQVYNDYTIVSSDDIRAELFGDASIQGDPKQVFAIAEDRVCNYLSNEQNVVFDATNINAKKRAAFLSRVRQRVQTGVHAVCVVVVASPEVCIQRQAQRDRKVPAEVIERMVRNFQVPYYWEGWNEIKVFRTDLSYSVEEDFNSQEDLPHDNPYHAETVKEHMNIAESLAAQFAEERELFACDILFIKHVAKYHDIGKFYTKVFHNRKGEKTSVAHYYNHENVGAYLYLCSLSLAKNSLNLLGAFLIQCHMLHYSDFDFYNRRLREPKVIKLMRVLEDADENASFIKKEEN